MLLCGSLLIPVIGNFIIIISENETYSTIGYYLYFTSFCVIECMHVHASDNKLTEGGSAKFFVKSNGDSVVQNRGILNDREIARISDFIKDHYQEMYIRWSQYSDKGYYGK